MKRAAMVVGTLAHVAVAIPRRGVGSIALVMGSRRTTLPARCHQDRAIARGTEVVVIGQRGRVVLVTPFQTDDELAAQ
ncbi:MAG TPA: hypothetical protein VM686_42105 [Polyangiaceae bacterium]|nr:hypothetical protein [Polyangiaceae bacterium]